jgi:hypothetical protein
MQEQIKKKKYTYIIFFGIWTLNYEKYNAILNVILKKTYNSLIAFLKGNDVLFFCLFFLFKRLTNLTFSTYNGAGSKIKKEKKKIVFVPTFKIYYKTFYLYARIISFNI